MKRDPLARPDSRAAAPGATAAAAAPGAGAAGAEPSRATAHYVLAVLVAVAALNIVDRHLFGLLIEPIKRDLGLSDTWMGLLAGFTFALFYTVCGLPVARWADRGVRRSIIALGLFLWSGMTALCGLSQNLLQLALARIGVGIGEAAGAPPSHSLVCDYFPPERRASALAITSMGGSLGLILALLGGGFVAQRWGWRAAFLAAGLPGLALALLVRLTVREPVRGRFDAPRSSVPRPSTREALRFLFGLRSYRHLIAAGSLHSFAGVAAASWNAVFLMRVHGQSVSEAGAQLALLNATFAAIGITLWGFAVDRLAARDLRWYQWLPALGTTAALPFLLGFLLWPDPGRAILFLAPASLLAGAWVGPGHAMHQGLARPELRSTSSALALLIMNLIGLGLGPTAVGFLNERLDPAFGPEAVRYSLLLVAVASLWGAGHNLLAARTLREDLAAKERPAS
jgi:predicted MFS family arabinose efflux permease